MTGVVRSVLAKRALRKRGSCAAAVAALALAWAAGTVRAEPEPAGQTTAPVVPSRFASDLRAVDDPARDGWDTEVFAESAKHQLHELLRGVDDRATPTAESAGRFVTADFRAGDLCAPDPAQAYADATLIVRRGPCRPPEAAFAPATGPAALVAALAPLVGRVSALAQVRHAVKVVSVEPEAGFVTTRAFLEVFGTAPGRAFQATATWTCRWAGTTAEKSPRLASLAVTDYEEVEAAAPSGTLFADCTAAALGNDPCWRGQLAFGMPHWLARIQNALGCDRMGRHGLAIGDADGDGLDDVYVCQAGGLPNRLLMHHPDGTVADRAAAAGVDLLDRTSSALFLDLDGDGDQDLLAATSQGIAVFANDGKGSFARREVLPVGAEDVQSMAAADFDGDCDLDVYVCVDFSDARGRRADPRRRFLYHDAQDGGRNVLFRNDGALRFVDVTEAAGLEEGNFRHSLAAAWEDYDDDGDPDLYVANDYGPNQLFRNDGGRFVDVAAEAGAQDFGSGMSVSWGDYDRDGRFDLYVANMFSSAGSRVMGQERAAPQESPETRARLRRFAKGNTLLRNLGGGKFEDVGAAAGVEMGRWAWSSNFVDLNGDGREDLVVANGYITGEDPDDL